MHEINAAFRRALALTAAVLSASCAAPRRAPSTSSATLPSVGGGADTFSVPHDSLVIESRILHESRLINVHLPDAYRDGARSFPVLYMPDGGMDEDFPHVVRAVEALVARNEIPPTMVVGIPNTQRRRDLTGPTRVASDSAIAPRVGGSADFRAFIRDEVIPVIERRYRTTADRSIIGESLAGLFIVETFLREPTLFDRYVAFDPSLWWNHAALVDSTAALLSAASRTSPKRLFVAVSHDGIDDRSSRFADALRRLAPSTVQWTFESHPELGHGNIFAALERRGLAYGLGQPPLNRSAPRGP
jgi:predicted alpha/beta superfamily hydrolase